MAEPLTVTNVNVFDSVGIQIDGAGKTLLPGLIDAPHLPVRGVHLPDRRARYPYPGRLGVVAEGATADLILVDGDPVADISLIGRPEEAFLAIIKGGQLAKGAELRTGSSGRPAFEKSNWSFPS
jgi:imidazolonepropionase-like amidohydrolase